jgi:hypothetical protein
VSQKRSHVSLAANPFVLCSSDASDYEGGSERVGSSTPEEANERTSLLPPSGISSNEHDAPKSYTRESRRSRQRTEPEMSRTQEKTQLPETHDSVSKTQRMDNASAAANLDYQVSSFWGMLE